jgi:hypothetical protein
MGENLSVDIDNPSFLQLISSVLFELQGIFTSPYLHLGFPPDRNNKGCFDEAGISPDFDGFEIKLESLMALHGYSLDRVVRWESSDGNDKEKRAGHVTHSYMNTPSSKGGNNFVSTGLFLEHFGSELQDAFAVYQHTVMLAKTSPAAVLAWAGPVSDTTWKLLLMRERLLAVAIGLSNPNLDRSGFAMLYKERCAAVANGELECNLQGKIPQDRRDAAQWRQEKDAKDLKEAVCSTRTRMHSIYMARKGVLVPYDDEEREPTNTEQTEQQTIPSVLVPTDEERESTDAEETEQRTNTTNESSGASVMTQ